MLYTVYVDCQFFILRWVLVLRTEPSTLYGMARVNLHHILSVFMGLRMYFDGDSHENYILPLNKLDFSTVYKNIF
jgi:hypothetical protein